MCVTRQQQGKSVFHMKQDVKQENRDINNRKQQ